MLDTFTNIDPYAPQKNSEENYSNRLDENGYTYKDVFFANEKFKSPPICVKLDIPISSESKNQLRTISLSASCQMSFYFSEKYCKRRRSRIIMCLSILTASILMSIFVEKSTDYKLNGTAIFVPLVLIPISLCLGSHRLTIINHTIKYYQIKGVHKNLLQVLPALPIVVQNKL